MAVTQIVTRQIKDAAITLVKLLALAKGSLITGNGTTNAALTVGTDGQLLSADSTVAATGLRWVTFAGLTPTNFVFSEVPTGTVNGSNAAFTIANTPTAGTVQVYVNGVRQKVGTGNDYTITGTTITFEAGTAIPVTGDVIQVDYLK